MLARLDDPMLDAPLTETPIPEEEHVSGVATMGELVTVDTETTGLWWGSRLVELAAVRFRGSEVIGRWSARINPERDIPEAVTKIHGIDDAAIAHCPTARDILRDFSRFIAGATMLAHNAEFDRDILGTEYLRAGLTPPSEPMYCTLKLARKLAPESPRFGLQKLAAHFALDQEHPHQALADAELTRLLYEKLRARMGHDEVAIVRRDGSVEGRPFLVGEGITVLAPTHPARFPWSMVTEGERVTLVTETKGERTTHEGLVRLVYGRGDEAWVDLETGAGRVVSVAMEGLVAALARG